MWGSEHEVTAIENNEKIAVIYQDFFPNDTVIVADAHEYLLQHFKEFDFIWSSPPCPTHGTNNRVLHAEGIIRYPDMALYQEIIFLRQFYKGKWTIENVRPYYEPLIEPQIRARHCFWANFYIREFKDNNNISITNNNSKTRRTATEHKKELQDYHGINCNNIKYLSNCVLPELGKHILDCARSKSLF